MLVAFYSNVRGNAGTTSNLCCLATFLAVSKKQRILLWENHTNWNMIQDTITPRTKLSLLCDRLNPYYIDGAKELFCRLLSNENLNLTEQVQELAKELYPNTLFYLSNRQIEASIFEKEISRILPRFLKLCKESDDLVFMDLQDSSKESTKYILEHADLVVINLIQHSNSLDKFFLGNMPLSNIRYLIGNYQPNSKINIKNICRSYKIPIMDIAMIPYNTLYREAMSEGKLIDFITANTKCRREDSNYTFIHGVEQAADMLNEAVEQVRQYKREAITSLSIQAETELPIQPHSKGRCEDCYI